MARAYRITVFGRPGCDKCQHLLRRAEALLAQGEWADFEIVYEDLGTPEGLVAFCKAEVLNPNRLPAMIVSKRNPETGAYEPLPDPRRGEPGAAGRTRLFGVLGLQTDYTEAGGGVLTPGMIRAVLEEARGL